MTFLVVACALSALLAVVSVVMGNFLAVFDIVLFVVLAIVIGKTKSWGAVLVSVIYGGINVVISLALGGTPGGIVALVVGITTMPKLRKYSQAYALYKKTGEVPAEEIN